MEWLSDPRAPFVLAAYSVAAVILSGILLVSLWQHKRSQSALRQLQERWKVHKQ